MQCYNFIHIILLSDIQRKRGEQIMKCPKCGNELRESKKNPGYFLCDSCKKKFSQETLNQFAKARAARKTKKPQIQAEAAPSQDSIEKPKVQTYSNIPPEHIRVQREEEMKANYNTLLNIKEEDSKNTDANLSSFSENPSMINDEPACQGLRILIGIISLLSAVFLGYQAYSSGIISTFMHTHDLTGTAGMILAACLLIGGIVTLCTQNRNSAASFIVPAIFYLGGSIGCLFIPGSVFITQIFLYASGIFGAFMLFALCTAYDVHMILRILVLLLALAAVGGATFASEKFVIGGSTNSGKNLRLSTDNFTVSFEKTEVGTDYEGNEALLVYYTITNKGKESIVPSVAVTFKAMQDNTTLESTIVPDEKLTDNETKEIGQGDSVRVCTSFILLDKSDVTLQVYESFGSGAKTAETTIKLE